MGEHLHQKGQVRKIVQVFAKSNRMLLNYLPGEQHSKNRYPLKTLGPHGKVFIGIFHIPIISLMFHAILAVQFLTVVKIYLSAVPRTLKSAIDHSARHFASHKPFQCIRSQIIIGIHKKDIFSGSLIKSNIPCRRHTACAFCTSKLYLQPVPVTDIWFITSITYHDYFKITETLI